MREIFVFQFSIRLSGAAFKLENAKGEGNFLNHKKASGEDRQHSRKKSEEADLGRNEPSGMRQKEQKRCSDKTQDPGIKKENGILDRMHALHQPVQLQN